MTEEKLKVEMIKIKDELLKENKLNIGELIKTTIKKFSSSYDKTIKKIKDYKSKSNDTDFALVFLVFASGFEFLTLVFTLLD